MSEYDSEPVPGLPAHLPAGEVILWQGAPSWKSLARRALHVRKAAIYFALLLAWSVVSALYDGHGLGGAMGSLLWLLVLSCAAVGLLSLLAWLIARTTLYTVTNRRVVMRFGVALPMSINLPFKKIESASLATFADGSGDIPLVLGGEDRISYLIMWPHVRPWRIARPEPMLRALPEASVVAETLSRALAAAADLPERRVSTAEQPPEWTGAEVRPLASAAS